MGGDPAAAPVFVLEAQLMQAGRSGRQCRERASRRCSPCDCGLHPGKWPRGDKGRDDRRLGDRSGPLSVSPGLPFSFFEGHFPSERVGRRQALGRTWRWKEPAAPGAHWCSAPSAPVDLLPQKRKLFLVSPVPPCSSCPIPRTPSPISQSVCLPLDFSVLQ